MELEGIIFIGLVILIFIAAVLVTCYLLNRNSNKETVVVPLTIETEAAVELDAPETIKVDEYTGEPIGINATALPPPALPTPTPIAPAPEKTPIVIKPPVRSMTVREGLSPAVTTPTDPDMQNQESAEASSVRNSDRKLKKQKTFCSNRTYGPSYYNDPLFLIMPPVYVPVSGVIATEGAPTLNPIKLVADQLKGQITDTVEGVKTLGNIGKEIEVAIVNPEDTRCWSCCDSCSNGTCLCVCCNTCKESLKATGGCICQCLAGIMHGIQECIGYFGTCICYCVSETGTFFVTCCETCATCCKEFTCVACIKGCCECLYQIPLACCSLLGECGR